MAKFALTNFVLLSLVSYGLAGTINNFLELGNLRQIQQEGPQQVVEIVRWRQPVCLTSAPGVLPCMVSLQNLGSSHPGNHHYSKSYPQQNRPVQTEAKPLDDELLKKLTQDDSAIDKSSLESIEEDDIPSKRSPRSVPTPKLYSPRIVKSVELENLGASSLNEPVVENVRRKRYLRFVSPMPRSETNRQTTYVTRVVDSPIVATLVATTCLPDIGIPLCDENRDSPHRPGNYPPPNPNNYPTHGSSPHYPINYPTSGGNPHYPSNYPAYGNYPNYPPYYPTNYPTHGSSPNHPTNSSTSGNNNNGQQQGPQLPGYIQNIADFITQPNTVQANQTPEVKPVVVVQPASPPGLLDGITAFLMPNGSWFGVFGGNAPGAIQLPQLPQFPQLPPLPQVPTLQEILYRPENDISDTPNVLNIFNLTNNYNPPGAGPPTQSPGIFGSMFASPTGPQGINNPVPPSTTTTTTTAAPSILAGIGNLFRPTSRPIVIESPNQHPIVIERPVYVSEQPVIPGIFDILQFPNRPVRLNSTADAEVITDPVYVLQQPGQGPFGGLLPNFNLFGTSSTTTTTTTTTTSRPTPTYAAPTNNNHPNYYPTQQYGSNYPPTYNGAVNIPINPHQPTYSNPPNVIPGYPNVNSGPGGIPPNSEPYGYSKSNGIVASEGYVTSIVPNETSTPDSVYSNINLEESSTIPETDLLGGSLTEIVYSEGEKNTDLAGDNFVGKDVLDTAFLAEEETHQESKKIDDVGITKEINNEA